MGRATAHLFADEGARVGVADLDGAGAERVAGEIRAAGGEALGFALDVTDAARVVHGGRASSWRASDASTSS